MNESDQEETCQYYDYFSTCKNINIFRTIFNSRISLATKKKTLLFYYYISVRKKKKIKTRTNSTTAGCSEFCINYKRKFNN